MVRQMTNLFDWTGPQRYMSDLWDITCKETEHTYIKLIQSQYKSLFTWWTNESNTNKCPHIWPVWSILDFEYWRGGYFCVESKFEVQDAQLLHLDSEHLQYQNDPYRAYAKLCYLYIYVFVLCSLIHGFNPKVQLTTRPVNQVQLFGPITGHIWGPCKTPYRL